VLWSSRQSINPNILFSSFLNNAKVERKEFEDEVLLIVGECLLIQQVLEAIMIGLDCKMTP